MVQCLKKVGTENPLVLLDEIDKLGKSRRDPEGALLELLDPEQNAHFLDHFLDVPIDLSKVLFVCTANNIDRLPGPLLDRMEVFEHAVDGGSTREESREVAEKFTVDESNLSDYVEGKGGLHITGHLGRVMKESAEIAHTVAGRIMFEKEPDNLFFSNSKLHLHVPEGATPKDGPSAGCTMITSLLSLAMKKPIRKDLAMTGEVTLTGRILPIGGLKEKTMAARRSQVKVIIFPEANRRDFEGLEESVKERLDVHFVDEYEQIFELAFGDDH
ncbi:hypothetical protein F2Q70_00042732 [Brassica cretica]|uniref:Lon proteolytic domain-containing protein n=1 Tax=Brassica cretica TaxID=69181 RepID=A0A8S9KKD9_BRACR|nr:hypothetical protein F2Q70_00042732 [Brassica cretica]